MFGYRRLHFVPLGFEGFPSVAKFLIVLSELGSFLAHFFGCEFVVVSGVLVAFVFGLQHRDRELEFLGLFLQLQEFLFPLRVVF
jgi:hypothetical protein